MNTSILQQYGLTMRKSSRPFYGYVEGFLGSYLSLFRHPDDVQDMIDDIDLALNGQFNKITDSDYGTSLAGDMNTYWHAKITPLHFEIQHVNQPDTESLAIPLQDWKEILKSWKECIEA